MLLSVILRRKHNRGFVLRDIPVKMRRKLKDTSARLAIISPLISSTRFQHIRAISNENHLAISCQTRRLQSEII